MSDSSYAGSPGNWRLVTPMNPDRAYAIGTIPPTDDPDDADWEIVAEVCDGPTAYIDALLIMKSPKLLAACKLVLSSGLDYDTEKVLLEALRGL